MEKSEIKQDEIPQQTEEQETVEALQQLFNDPSNKGGKKRLRKLEKKMLGIRIKRGIEGKDFTVPLNQGGNLRMHQTFSGTLYMRDKNGALHRMSDKMLEEIKNELADSSLAPRPVGLLNTDTNIGLPHTPNS